MYNKKEGCHADTPLHDLPVVQPEFLGQSPECLHQRIDILRRIVDSQCGPHDTLQSEPAQNGLRTVMSRPHGDPVAV